MNPLELVTDWHRKFGVAIPETPSFDASICALRISLLTEENAELYAALETNNRVEVLDALCDLQYVLSGAVASTGVAEFLQPIRPMLPEQPMFIIRQFSFHIAKLQKDFDRGYPTAAGGRLSALQWLLDLLIEATGFRGVFDGAFMAVHENNCAKVWTQDEVVMKSSEGTFSECDWKPGFYIVRNSIGKIIKPPGHTKVDLGRFVE